LNVAAIFTFFEFIKGSVVNHGAAIVGTTILGRPILLLPRKNMALLKFVLILGTDPFMTYL
jgi:hypothetical protein